MATRIYIIIRFAKTGRTIGRGIEEAEEKKWVLEAETVVREDSWEE